MACMYVCMSAFNITSKTWDSGLGKLYAILPQQHIYVAWHGMSWQHALWQNYLFFQGGRRQPYIALENTNQHFPSSMAWHVISIFYYPTLSSSSMLLVILSSVAFLHSLSAGMAWHSASLAYIVTTPLFTLLPLLGMLFPKLGLGSCPDNVWQCLALPHLPIPYWPLLPAHPVCVVMKSISPFPSSPLPYPIHYSCMTACL